MFSLLLWIFYNNTADSFRKTVLLECDHEMVYHVAWMFGGGKLWQLSYQKLLTSKTLINFCLLAFFIVHTINSFGYQCVATHKYNYITHLSENEAGWTDDI